MNVERNGVEEDSFIHLCVQTDYMQRQKDFILRTWPFLLVTFLYCIIGLSLDKYYGEIPLHQLLNQYNSSLADFIFPYYTQTGEWILSVLVILYLIYKSTWRYLYLFLTVSAAHYILIQVIKRVFFINHLRPAYLFKEKGLSINLVEGFEQSITYTYPSGHSATAFCVFGFLCLLTNKNGWKLFWGLAAIATAYSRIYLSQHFMQDTIAGGAIGLFCLIVCYYLWQIKQAKSLDKPVLKTKT